MTANPAFDRKGRLWLAFSVGKTVYVAGSTDGGKSFSAPASVATISDGMIDAHGDARPKIVALDDGIAACELHDAPRQADDRHDLHRALHRRRQDFLCAASPCSPKAASASRPMSSPRRGASTPAGSTRRTRSRPRPKARTSTAAASPSAGRTTRRDLQRQEDPARSRLRVLPHVRGARQGRAAGLRLASGVRRRYPRPLRRETFRRRNDAFGRARQRRQLGDQLLPASRTRRWRRRLASGTSSGSPRARRGRACFTRRAATAGRPSPTPDKLGDDARAPGHPVAIAAKGRLYRVWKEFDGTTTTVAAADVARRRQELERAARDGRKPPTLRIIPNSSQQGRRLPLLGHAQGRLSPAAAAARREERGRRSEGEMFRLQHSPRSSLFALASAAAAALDFKPYGRGGLRADREGARGPSADRCISGR